MGEAWKILIGPYWGTNGCGMAWPITGPGLSRAMADGGSATFLIFIGLFILIIIVFIIIRKRNADVQTVTSYVPRQTVQQPYVMTYSQPTVVVQPQPTHIMMQPQMSPPVYAVPSSPTPQFVSPQPIYYNQAPPPTRY